MSEQDKQQLGDGSINYADAAQKTAKAIKEAGKAAAEKTAAAAGEATANTTAAVAQAGVEGGKAVAEVATGTAAGGPWGAIIAAAWALRKPIFKVLICLGLVILLFIMAVVTLPSIISNNLFHTDPSTVDPNGAVDLIERADDMSDLVAACIQNGYDAALARVEQIIEENGYDYETSMDALVNYGSLNPDYEVCYVFAAYSASMGQVGTSEADMRRKLDAVAEQMFKVTYEEKEFERVIPLTYSTYTPVTLSVITGRTKIGEVNGVSKYSYTTATRTYYVPSGEASTETEILTSGAASTYMFTSFEMSDDSGVLLGINRHNNSLCVVDLFNTRVNKNANVTLLGTSGAGKNFTMQLLALRMRMRGIQCYILAPLKGHEFKRACAAVGGTYIKISPGSTNCINVMEIRRTLSPEMELIDEMDYNSEDSLLSRKIQQLLIFFSLLIPDMSNEEEQMLDEALVRSYRQFGITHDNDSLYADKAHTRYKRMPILGDLHKLLEANPLTQRLAIIVSRFVTGSAQSFNQQTNVNLENKYVVIDISELKGKLLPVGMFISLDYIWDQVKSDRTKRKAIYIDEIWQLIGASSNRQAGEFCQEIFKIARGYGAAAIAASQDLSDFFSLEDGKYGRAIINNSKTKIILNLEPDEAEYVRETLKLTRTEIRSITQFERGEALISSNNNKVPVLVRASKVEQQLITTDRSELAAILKERQRAQKTQTEGNAFSEE